MNQTLIEQPASEGEASTPAEGDAIAKLAYELWLRRGCPYGSPDQDWYEAERLLTGSVEDLKEAALEGTSTPSASRKSKATAV